jgi:hypothetical protein
MTTATLDLVQETVQKEVADIRELNNTPDGVETSFEPVAYTREGDGD